MWAKIVAYWRRGAWYKIALVVSVLTVSLCSCCGVVTLVAAATSTPNQPIAQTSRATAIAHIPGHFPQTGGNATATATATATPAPTSTPTPVPTATATPLPPAPPTDTPAPVPTNPPAPVPTTPPPAPQSCYPLTNSGNCYEPGEYCRSSDHGASGIAGDGERITCTYNNGWRWEPS